jgi:hypothetical protein
MTAKQKQFLLLRADGLSFDNITKKLNVSKPTLIKWSRLFMDDINDLQFQSLATLKEQYHFNKRAKFEQLLKHLSKVDVGIENADLAHTTLKDLITVRNNLVVQLEMIEKQTSYINSGLTQKNFLGESEIIKVTLGEIE